MNTTAALRSIRADHIMQIVAGTLMLLVALTAVTFNLEHVRVPIHATVGLALLAIGAYGAKADRRGGK
jgi:hypothetical protein